MKLSSVALTLFSRNFFLSDILLPAFTILLLLLDACEDDR